MLKNYYSIDTEITAQGFLKEPFEKKNFQYIILEPGDAFIDIRTLALSLKGSKEKLKSLSKKLPKTLVTQDNEKVDFLIKSSERVILTPDGTFDFINALKYIKSQKKLDFLNESLDIFIKDEIYALTFDDTVRAAKNLFKQKGVNLLPVLQANNLVGEVRPKDLLVDSFFLDNSKRTQMHPSLNLLSVHVTNIMNVKPLTIDVNAPIKELLHLMISKSLASVIITRDNELCSIVSYGDIFKLYKQETTPKEYTIEYVGLDQTNVYTQDKIKELFDMHMRRIHKREGFDHLKIVFKEIRNKNLTISIMLSRGNSIERISLDSISKDYIKCSREALRKLKTKFNN